MATASKPASTKTRAPAKSAAKPAAKRAAAAADKPASTAYKAGQTLVCTLLTQPRTETDALTIQRLMRQDGAVKRALRSGHESRMANLHVRSRGGRPWEVRAKSAKIARAEKGVSWTMKFFPQIGPDLQRVAHYISVKAG